MGQVNLIEILKKHSDVSHGSVDDFWFTDNVLKAMQEACYQAIDLCAENVVLEWDCYCQMSQHDEEKFDNTQDVWIDKESILNTKKQII